jgi:zinc/manganese transport system permease protein
MNLDSASFGILLPAFLAGLLVSMTLVPMGMQVLSRGIVFIDLAVAQIAGLGVIVADALGWEPQGYAVQIAALSAALAGALLLTWTERRWPEVQEAIIGVVFVLAACIALLLLAGNPHGGEHLKDLLVGQILWVDTKRLAVEALAYIAIAALWFAFRERLGRIGFYLLFACAVTLSVQQVGLYLVFATLIVPALATHYAGARRLPKAYAVAVAGYASGLAASAWLDLPSGAMIVCTMVAAGIALAWAAAKPSGKRA